MIELESIEVGRIEDGAQDKLAISWIEKSTDSSVPACQRQIIVTLPAGREFARQIMEAAS